MENAKLFGNLSLSVAIASFLHLSFVYDMKYPQVYKFKPTVCFLPVTTLSKIVKVSLKLGLFKVENLRFRLNNERTCCHLFLLIAGRPDHGRYIATQVC